LSVKEIVFTDQKITKSAEWVKCVGIFAGVGGNPAWERGYMAYKKKHPKISGRF